MGCCESRDVRFIQLKNKNNKEDTSKTEIIVEPNANSLGILHYSSINDPKIKQILAQLSILDSKND